MKKILIAITVALSVIAATPGFAANPMTGGGGSGTFAGTENTTGSAGSLKSPDSTGLTQISGPAAGTTRKLTIPDANTTLGTAAAANLGTGAGQVPVTGEYTAQSSGAGDPAGACTAPARYLQTTEHCTWECLNATWIKSSCEGAEGSYAQLITPNSGAYTPVAGTYGYTFSSNLPRWIVNGALVIPQLQVTEKLAVFNIPGASADGTVADSYIPVASTITGWVMTTDGAACSAVIDVWSQAYADFPPAVANTIIQNGKPTLSTAQMGQQITAATIASNWTEAVPADAFLRANLDSSDCTGNITLTILGTK